MGVEIVAWRSTIGNSSQPFKASKWKISAITLGEKAWYVSRIHRFLVLLALLYTSFVYSGELTENLHGRTCTVVSNHDEQWNNSGVADQRYTTGGVPVADHGRIVGSCVPSD